MEGAGGAASEPKGGGGVTRGAGRSGVGWGGWVGGIDSAGSKPGLPGPWRCSWDAWARAPWYPSDFLHQHRRVPAHRSGRGGACPAGAGGWSRFGAAARAVRAALQAPRPQAMRGHTHSQTPTGAQRHAGAQTKNNSLSALSNPLSPAPPPPQMPRTPAHTQAARHTHQMRPPGAGALAEAAGASRPGRAGSRTTRSVRESSRRQSKRRTHACATCVRACVCVCVCVSVRA